jgi:hypothetical protein
MLSIIHEESDKIAFTKKNLKDSQDKSLSKLYSESYKKFWINSSHNRTTWQTACSFIKVVRTKTFRTRRDRKKHRFLLACSEKE